MERNTFYVLLSIRTADGFENFGKFNLGDNRKVAAQVFRQLKGSAAVDETTLLTIELMETINDLPLNLNILACTLDELAYNTRIITRETFKFHNLEK
jgi:hypothetical protein